MLHRPCLCPGREVEQQEAGVLAPARDGERLARRRDALHHRFDLTPIGCTEKVVALDLGDVGHAPPLHRKRVLALASHAAMMALGHEPPRSAMTPRCADSACYTRCRPALLARARRLINARQRTVSAALLALAVPHGRSELRSGLRRRLAEAGARRAACFTWQRSAAQHAALYRSLAS